MKSDIELARALITSANKSKTKRSEERSVTTIINGIAEADSSNGSVSVRLTGNVKTTSGSITIPCVGAISKGQTVIISATGAPGRARSLVAIGAVGAGDALVDATLDFQDDVARLSTSMSELSSNVVETRSLAVEAASTADSVEKKINPQISAFTSFAKLAMPTMTPTMSTSDIVSVSSLLPEWAEGKTYNKGEAIKRNGTVYRVTQYIAQSSSIYPPETAGASLYIEIDVAPDGVRIWRAPTMAEDSYSLGERVHYPDKDGDIYISLRTGNTSEPGKDSWWKKEE
mgnify:CR=1 FL=1